MRTTPANSIATDDAVMSDMTAGSGVGGRDEQVFQQARRHSRQVYFIKIALPVVAIVLATGFFVYSWLGSPPNIDVSLEGSSIRDGKLVMANPKLDGFGKDNRPYTMAAARAIQDLSNTNTIVLEEIAAKLPVGPDEFALVNAANGVYDNEKSTLDITSPLTMKTTDGLTARLQSAFIDITNGELKSAKPVDIRMDGSQIQADTFEVLERGKVFVFEKRVRMEIDPKRVRSSDAEDGEADAQN